MARARARERARGGGTGEESGARSYCRRKEPREPPSPPRGRARRRASLSVRRARTDDGRTDGVEDEGALAEHENGEGLWYGDDDSSDEGDGAAAEHDGNREEHEGGDASDADDDDDDGAARRRLFCTTRHSSRVDEEICVKLGEPDWEGDEVKALKHTRAAKTRRAKRAAADALKVASCQPRRSFRFRSVWRGIMGSSIDSR